MKIDIQAKIESVNKEVVDIHIEFDPMNTEEERIAALITTLADFSKNYDLLRAASNDV